MKRILAIHHSPRLMIGLCLSGLLGIGILATKGKDWAPTVLNPTTTETNEQPSQVLGLIDQDPDQRLPQLQTLAAQHNNSVDRSRARYLLAMAYLEDLEGSLALEQLENLEKQYSVLKPYILIKRGRAYELTNDLENAQTTWLSVVNDYAGDPVAAEALYRLGNYDPKYWEQAIADYPAHPRSQDLIKEKLKENPAQPNLLALRLRYEPDAPDIAEVRQTLIDQHGDQLTPDIWQAIADSYWDQWQYGEAAKAYQKAPKTPQNLYRIARGFHIAKETQNATNAYRSLFNSFPDAPETGLGMRRYASLVSDKEALTYLDQTAQKFPEEAPEALFTKANLLDKLGSGKSAAQTREVALQRFRNNDATSEYRWEQAEKYAKEGNYTKAWEWAQTIAADTPNHPLAAESLFWIGKWAIQLNRTQEATQAFTKVLQNYPESYYAWRSAVHLGWDVGDFTTVRNLQPQINLPNTRPTPPAGSPTFQELYRLGQDYDAWNIMQTELAGKSELTVEEQFTAGLLKLSQEKYLKGINTIWNLSQRDDPGDRRQWQQLRQRSDYWYALFPFPYEEPIQEWSAKHGLNPLLVVALMRQESRFEKNIKSPVGATGLMQVMPATGEWISQQISDPDYALDDPEDNIQFGTWYLNYTHQEYANNSMLAVASYNAGPGNVAQWVRQFNIQDPDFFVEQIPFGETKNYVETVFANYWNYQRLYNPELQQKLKKLLPS